MSRNPRSSAARNKRRELLENLKKAKEGGISRTELLEVFLLYFFFLSSLFSFLSLYFFILISLNLFELA